MSGTDIFIAILCAVMLFGGLYLNILSRKLAANYIETHKAEQVMQKSSTTKNTKLTKK